MQGDGCGEKAGSEDDTAVPCVLRVPHSLQSSFLSQVFDLPRSFLRCMEQGSPYEYRSTAPDTEAQS